MVHNLKTLPVVTTITDSSVLFGADDGQSGAAPDPIAATAIKDYVLADPPTPGGSDTEIQYNNFGALDGTPNLTVTPAGSSARVTVGAGASGGGLDLANDEAVIRLGGLQDVIIGRQSSGTLLLGGADSSSPLSQVIHAQSVAAGTLNTAGVDMYIHTSNSTGNTVGGSLIISSCGTGGVSGTQKNPGNVDLVHFKATSLTNFFGDINVLGGQLGVGDATGNTGQLRMQHASSVFITTIQSGNAVAHVTYTLPTNVGAAGSVLTDAAGNGTLSWVLGGAIQALSGAGAVNLTTLTTAFTSTGGAQALTLANGTVGQIKHIIHVVDGGSGVLTPTNLLNGTTITFTNIGDAVTLQFINTEWHVLSLNGAVLA